MTKGSRPEQAVLSRDTDMSKTEETRKVIEGMVDGLNDHRIADIGEFFSDGFRWMGNAGCGCVALGYAAPCGRTQSGGGSWRPRRRAPWCWSLGAR